MPLDAHPPPLTPPQIEELREAVRLAAAPLSYVVICWMCRNAGLALDIEPDSLSRFGDGRVKSINALDAMRLRTFLFDTETGRLIRRSGNGPVSVFDELVISLSQGARSRAARTITGSFFTLHGSYMRPGHFVVRATLIAEKSDGLLCVEDYLRETDALTDDPIHRAYGIVTFDAAKPTFLLRRNDNSLGSNLIVADRVSPATRRIDRIIGTKLGMTSEHRHFSRAVLIARTPTPMTARDMFARTGIFTFDALEPEMKELVMRLRRNLPSQVFSDPLLDLPV